MPFLQKILRIGHLVKALLFVPLMAFASQIPAQAASFDCSKATSPKEHFICSDRKLSAEDSELGKAYRAAMSQLSAQDALELRDDERTWLKTLWTNCADFDGNLIALCLDDKYQTRISVLENMNISSNLSASVGNEIENLIGSTQFAATNDSPFILGRLENAHIVTPLQENDKDFGGNPVDWGRPFQQRSDLQNFLNSIEESEDSDFKVSLAEAGSWTYWGQWSQKYNIGTVYTSNGSDGCDHWIVFSAENNKLVLAQPEVLTSEDYCPVGFVGFFRNHIVAIYETSSDERNEEIALQVWTGDEWSKVYAFDVNQSIKLVPLYQSGVPQYAEKLSQVARTLVERADAHGIANYLNYYLNSETHLGPVTIAATSVSVTFNANTNNLITPLFMPIMETKLEGGNDLECPENTDECDFQNSAEFSFDLEGQKIFGRIGNGGMPSHTDTNALIAFWSEQGKHLTPLAAFVFVHSPAEVTSIMPVFLWKPFIRD